MLRRNNLKLPRAEILKYCEHEQDLLAHSRSQIRARSFLVVITTE